MSMVGEKRGGNDKEITTALDTYVTNHAKWMIESGQLRMFPPNLDTVYEYMRLYGDKGWRPKAPEMKDMLMYTGYAGYLPADAGVIQVNDGGQMRKAGGSTDNTLQKVVQQVAPAIGGSPVRNAVGAAAGAAVRKK